jgi:glycerophosphoryl diester phosphodiesterase
VLIFGHRGARGEAPENTLAGFAHAIRQGVLAIELDVRLSSDDQLVVIHDATVDRTTDGRGPVASFTAAELARLDARGPHTDASSSSSAPVGVPRLTEVLAVCAGRVRLAVEIKTDAPQRLERVCAALVEPLGDAAGRGGVAVTSFDPAALEMMRRLAPALPRAYIGAYDTPDFLETALRLECRQADIPLARGSAEAVREARARGLRVVGWLGNSEPEIESLLRWGVDGITSDFPARALAALRARGLPTADDWD